MKFIKGIASVIFLALPVALLFVQCKKDSKPQTKTEILTSGKWKTSSYTINPAFDWDGDGTTETDILSVSDECSKDDFVQFNSNGTILGDEGPTKCDPGDPQTFSLTWSFEENETKLNIDGDVYTIETLSDQQIKLSIVEDFDATSYTSTLVLVHY
jgi:hypothetical protein